MGGMESFFLAQAILSFLQGFANNSNGSFFTPGRKVFISTCNVLGGIISIVVAIIKKYWIGIAAAVGIYLIFCTLGSFFYSWLEKHPPK